MEDSRTRGSFIVNMKHMPAQWNTAEAHFQAKEANKRSKHEKIVVHFCFFANRRNANTTVLWGTYQGSIQSPRSRLLLMEVPMCSYATSDPVTRTKTMFTWPPCVEADDPFQKVVTWVIVESLDVRLLQSKGSLLYYYKNPIWSLACGYCSLHCVYSCCMTST